MVTKDDPELKFDDDVDNNMLAAMVTDPVTRSNPSCATSTATAKVVYGESTKYHLIVRGLFKNFKASFIKFKPLSSLKHNERSFKIRK